jgi:hypothetical protein
MLFAFEFKLTISRTSKSAGGLSAVLAPDLVSGAWVDHQRRLHGHEVCYHSLSLNTPDVKTEGSGAESGGLGFVGGEERGVGFSFDGR